MSKKKNSWKDNVATVVVLLIVAGFVVGFARVNNIHSFNDALDYIFALSHLSLIHISEPTRPY